MSNNAEAARIMTIDRGVPFNPEMLDVVEPILSPADTKVAEFMNRIGNAPTAASIPVPELSDDLNMVILTARDSALFGRSTPAAAAAMLRQELLGAIIN
jgi:multiple sugar transport system substrate-binding protein